MNATNLNRLLHLAALAAAVALLSDVKAATLLTQVDDFSSGVSGWGVEGLVGEIAPDGGPAGAGDAHLTYSSKGGGGAGSRMVIPQEDAGNQWQGDYLAAGVTGLEMDLLNFGNADLNMRLGIANGTTWFVTTAPVVVAPGAAWNSVAFQIDAASMTQLGGSDSFNEVAADVQRLRLLSSVNLPSVANQGGVRGDAIVASIGVDNIRAVGIPEPAGVALSVLGLGFAVMRRRHSV